MAPRASILSCAASRSSTPSSRWACLLWAGSGQAGRGLVARLADEAEPRGSRPPQQDEVLTAVQHGQVQGIAVEAGQLGRVGAVEVEGQQTDRRGAHGSGP